MSLTNIRRRATAQGGFSLIELLVVVLIIGILAAIMIPRFLGQRNNANNSQAQSALRNAASAAEAYFQQGEFYGDTASSTSSTNLVSFINTTEPGITASATALANPADTPGSGANPKNIEVGTVTAGKSGNVQLCNVSKGDQAYCIKLDGDAATVYGKGTTLAGAKAATAGW